ncbi:MAG TPA: lamin tail domain-containing protein [Baekduia sp.]|uniref:lamin tail domain-containing protein n=1 Tax=Baekduia sp. TaxID=2600305 RepID=UPI002B8E2267|nr:lamin tail domain-containing protein [Baekduia sp.]HMJ33180.1 lamin tail domain-containing protein [Baekduia sp.]
MLRLKRSLIAVLISVVAVSAASAVAVSAASAASADVVVSEFRVRGPSGGSDEFVELYNASAAPVDIGGWKLNASNNAGTTSTRSTIPTGTTIPGHAHYLLTNSATSGGPYSGAVPGDRTYASGITDDGGLAVLGPDNSIVDQVGLSSGSAYREGTPLASLGSTNADRSYERKPGAGAGSGTDTDDNSADFRLITPSDPQDLASAPTPPLDGSTSPSVSASASPSAADAGDATLLTAVVTPGTGPDSTFLSVAGDLASIGGSTTQSFYDDGTHGDVTPSDDTFSYQATVAAGTTVGAKSLPVTAGDLQGRTGTDAIAFTVTAPVAMVAIHDIQGAAHLSPYSGQTVATTGIVTAVRSNGFNLQDPDPDGDPATSEAVFVFTSSAPPAVGDAVRVRARVSEFRPGGASTGNLTTTELAGTPVVTVLSSGNALPAATVVGTGGRVPPGAVIDDDAAGDVETSGTFDPAADGLDFWESLEAMRVEIGDAVAVGPTETAFGETPVVSAGSASVRTPRGGVVARPGDFNPERVIVGDAIVSTPTLNVGDTYSGPLVGVLDYNFGNFFLEATQTVSAVSGGITRETTSAAGAGELAVATFNVENLDPTDGAAKFGRLAGIVVDNLRSPDVIAVEEVQDDDGAASDGTTDPSLTLSTLTAAIEAAGGPHYEYRQIDPVDGEDGGEPGGNIRTVFLYRTDRGLSFVDRPGATSTTPNAVAGSGDTTHLEYSPGRVDPENPAWTTSRKPLAGEFSYRGRKLFVIANHFNSKGGDDPLMGHRQPPEFASEAQRHRQATVLHDFVESIHSADPHADTIVLGDLNDFQFSQTLKLLEGDGLLHDLVDTLPANEQYTYDYEGNSEVLDHLLVSGDLFARPFEYDVVHVNSEFADQASDHDPQVVRLTGNRAPTASAGGPYTVDEGGSASLTASGTDPDDDSLTYAWDLDGDGTFEQAAQTVTFDAGDGPATRTVGVRVTDPSGESATDTATITVRNVAPTATFSAPGEAPAGQPFALALHDPKDPSAADTAAGFTYAFDCGDGSGFGAYSSASSRTCPTADAGTRAVGGRIRDADGGVTEYHATVRLTATYDSVCALARQYSARPHGADAVCATLAVAKRQAAAGHHPAARAALAAAQITVLAGRLTGNFTAQEAATLARLIGTLPA